MKRGCFGVLFLFFNFYAIVQNNNGALGWGRDTKKHGHIFAISL